MILSCPCKVSGGEEHNVLPITFPVCMYNDIVAHVVAQGCG